MKKAKKNLQTGKKHCGKWRNCSLRAIHPFPTVFLKDLYSKHVKQQSLFGRGLTPYQTTKFYTGSNRKDLRTTKKKLDSKIEICLERIENIVEKGENDGTSIFFFSDSVFKSHFFSG